MDHRGLKGTSSAQSGYRGARPSPTIDPVPATRRGIAQPGPGRRRVIGVALAVGCVSFAAVAQLREGATPNPAPAAQARRGDAAGLRAGTAFKSVRAVRASTVDQLLGVNADLMQGNWSSIAGPGGMLEQVKFIGAETIRVGVPDPAHWTAPMMQELVAAGIKFDLVVIPSESPGQNVAWIKDFLLRYPGSVTMVEGPNEPNNWGVSFNNKTGVEGAVLWQNEFHRIMNDDPVTARLPVYGMSSYPVVASHSDINNLHVYAFNGDQARHHFEQARSAQEAVDPGKPWGITEFGYFTIPGFAPAGFPRWQGIDEQTQAKLTANAYLEAASMGATHLSLYALRDWPKAQAGDFGGHFGLFRGDNSPKPAAVALHNIETVLHDSESATFVPGSLEYATTASADVRSLLMQRADGQFVLAFWKTPDVWDQIAKRPRGNPAENFDLRLAASAVSLEVFDPLVGPAAVQSVQNVAEWRLSVIDHPIFVVIGGGTAAAGPR